jgi:threonylcarbamoyladenosine tRNA methylthiotransferase MtaB
MGRHWYTAATYRAAIENLSSRTSVFGLGADVIAGFPGESDSDHAATIELVSSLPFTSLHVFSYSPRPGTAALRLGERMPSDIVSARAAELRMLARQKALDYMQKRIAQSADVIVTGAPVSGSGARLGLTQDYLTVQVASADPRGSRFDARLEIAADTLRAIRINT